MDRNQQERLAETARDIAPNIAGLRALALIGSRARGDGHSGSDWDFAVLADEGFGRIALLGALIDALQTDAVDVVRLESADGVMRYHAGRDGLLLWEASEGTWIGFVERATWFWLEAGPAIREGGEALLRSLGEVPPMTADDRAVLVQRVSAVERHLRLIERHRPSAPELLRPSDLTTSACLFHLMQALQIVLHAASSWCVRLGLGAPSSHRDAFERLAAAGQLPTELASRLKNAAAFRNHLVHGYEDLELAVAWLAMTDGLDDLRAFLACLRDDAAD